MTITSSAPTAGPLATVTFDLYRDIHKAIRAELFAVTLEAGRLDPTDLAGRVALEAQVADVVDLLVSHAEHEDGAIQPVLEVHLPDLAAGIETDHEVLEARMVTLREMAGVARDASKLDARTRIHQLYVELASFTSAYLAHQDVEERVVMPAVEQAVGVEAVIGIHGAVIGAIPPAELMRSLALMFPAMNVDDRVELLGGMRADAPAEAFAATVSLLRSVLDPTDAATVTARLGLS
ncbi:MAG TPA: hemerythrin domain-containing protein [Acidimicrobiales bacterium]|nr:hemerythrin domain-containing protein [Acidimicrobiales bacterium]